jgi:EPSP synthase (3-phosphoshikimate 1-carboxyvinyltransferase)
VDISDQRECFLMVCGRVDVDDVVSMETKNNWKAFNCDYIAIVRNLIFEATAKSEEKRPDANNMKLGFSALALAAMSKLLESNPAVALTASLSSLHSQSRATGIFSRCTVQMALAAAAPPETLTIAPIKSLDGTVTLPGSKSLSNRCLLLAALSEGNTKVDNLLESDDIRYMLEALDQLEVPVDRHSSESVTVSGRNGPIDSPNPDETTTLFLGNAGTAMRPLAAALCMGQGKFVLDGVPRMRERPIADLIDGLQQLGADVACVEETGCPPVTINAKGLKGGKVRSERPSRWSNGFTMFPPRAEILSII